MDRKTLAILGLAGGLAATAAALSKSRSGAAVPGARDSAGSHPLVIVPTESDVCAGDGAPARMTTELGPGSMTAALSGTHVLQGGDGELYLSVDLVARDADVGSRPPLNLAIVIDHSGSMGGDKIAEAREAARGLVTRLGDRDRAALIQYDNVAQVLVPSVEGTESGKRRLLAAIDSIRERGGTNLGAGLFLGRDQVMDAVEGHVNRVILLSDGKANVGMTDIPSLSREAGAAAEHGVRITTVGLGDDYNEDLMEALAESGRGQYYYVRDAAGLERVFAGELRALQATVATRTELRLEPSCAGVEIAEVFGYAARREGAAVVVPLSDLSGGDRRKVVARLRVPVARRGHVGVIRATLSYADAHGGPTRSVLAALGVEVTPETAAIQAGADKDVLAKVAQVETATTIRKAAEVYSAGDQAGAVILIRDAEKKMAERKAKYRLEAAAVAPAEGRLSATGAGMAATPPSAAAAPALTKGAKADALILTK
jgi:Ca-activated chloride channel homolog